MRSSPGRIARSSSTVPAFRQNGGPAVITRSPGTHTAWHTDPAAAEQAIYGELPLDQVYGIIAASDGATRGYQLLDLHSLTEVADQILTSPTDLSSIGQAIRTSETRQAAALQARANKVHDDLTIAAAHIFER